MIDMGDRDKKGGVNQEDFICLMKELGLIPKDKEKKKGDSDGRNSAMAGQSQDNWARAEQDIIEEENRQKEKQALLRGDQPTYGQPVSQ
jgi:hypothetical protein